MPIDCLLFAIQFALIPPAADLEEKEAETEGAGTEIERQSRQDKGMKEMGMRCEREITGE